ncbi:hypothetical protein ILUMI_05476 [Ignelater luminosus]|uniref:Uncharacterized protein n=1 Tax=Ignelater luminosus TaxID=2038154 RepID=A0A8K0D718_IGNLU|nr:hypothetical protein ILUMI_05476 [Ignelater luminosus]
MTIKISPAYIQSVLTDEDSVDENEGSLCENRSARQFCADAEIAFSNKERLGVSYNQADDVDVESVGNLHDDFTNHNLHKDGCKRYIKEKPIRTLGIKDMEQWVRFGKIGYRKPVSCHPRSKWKKSLGDNSKNLNKDAGIMYVYWVDSSVVTVASTCFGVEPVVSVERLSRYEKKNIDLSYLYVIKTYDKNMGKTDQMDHNLSW